MTQQASATFEPFTLDTAGFTFPDPNFKGRKALKPDQPGIYHARLIECTKVAKRGGKSGHNAKYVWQILGPRPYDPETEGVLYAEHPWPESQDPATLKMQRGWHTRVYMSILSRTGAEAQVANQNVQSDPRQWVGQEAFLVVAIGQNQNGQERGEITSYVHRRDYEASPGRMPEPETVAAVAPGAVPAAVQQPGFSAPVMQPVTAPGAIPGGYAQPQFAQQPPFAPQYAQPPQQQYVPAPGTLPQFVQPPNGAGIPGQGPGVNPALAMVRPQ